MTKLRIRFSLLAVILIANLILFTGISNSKPSEITAGDIEQLRILSPNNAPLKIVIADMGRSNEKLVRNIVRTAIEINESGDLPKEETVRAFILTSNANIISAQLKRAGIDDEKIKKYVEISDDALVFNDPWLQDFGEIAMAKLKSGSEPKLLILDSNRGFGLAEVPGALAKFWNCDYMKINKNETSGGDHGGNIEVTPDDVLILGSTASEGLIKLFSELGYKDRMAVVDTKWLAVGHCDEYLSVVPNPKSPSGYTIFTADPFLALEIIKQADEKELSENTSGRYRDYMVIIHRLLNKKDTAGAASDPDGEKELIKAAQAMITSNRQIKKIIDANVNLLMKKIDAVRGTPEGMHSIVPLPVIFWSGGRTTRSIAFLPGAVNLLSVRDHLIIPDQHCGAFNNYIRGIVKKAGFKSHFVEDMYYHDLMGEIHCGTNVLRHPNRYVVAPEHLPELYKRFMKARETLDGEKKRTMRVLNQGK
ncbi:MAG TPA: hypothetical protein DC017_03785 [Candidatus Wallbacteria bacterium]|nr:hypothetical protein [Candidatus Wallbacteria bacterium]